ncbi:MAG: helix-turn-helix transcriptional regulator, partial [Eubacterium sp.]|nr:helix-turn-helix transcriptional regulator [Eubacterium sp.]
LALLLKIANTTPEAPVISSQSAMIMDIRQYLDENYMNDLSLQSISNEFHISTYYLAHIFKEETGYSPMNYIIRRRIGEAQSLLITTRRSITDIASQVGFSNPNNFNIQFQKQVGLSPRAYRKTYTTPGLADQTKKDDPVN